MSPIPTPTLHVRPHRLHGHRSESSVFPICQEILPGFGEQRVRLSNYIPVVEGLYMHSVVYLRIKGSAK